MIKNISIIGLMIICYLSLYRLHVERQERRERKNPIIVSSFKKETTVHAVYYEPVGDTLFVGIDTSRNGATAEKYHSIH